MDWRAKGLESQPKMCGLVLQVTVLKKDFLLKQSNPTAVCRLNGQEKRLERGRPVLQQALHR